MNYEYVSWQRFLNDRNLTLPKLNFTVKNPRAKTTTSICSDFMSLDTETSHIPTNDNDFGYNTWVYQWAFSFPYDDDTRWIIYGRKPSEFCSCLLYIQDTYLLDEYKKIIIFVHNLSYDWSYLSRFLEQYLCQKSDFIAVAPHKIIQSQICGFEFRCSYRLSNNSLAGWGKENNIEHPKLVGEIDYKVVRYQDSPLNKSDWRYMFRDIISLDECLFKVISEEKDGLKSLPLTKTGYVRRECRKEFKKDRKNRILFEKNRLYEDTYSLCRNEFSGGYTHGNRFKASKTIVGRVEHRDFVSHYPSCQVTGTAPNSGFSLYYKNKGNNPLTIQDLIKYASDYCCLIQINIQKAILDKGITAPYLQSSKIKNGMIKKDKMIEDNGRILQFEGSSTIVLNEYDFKWIFKQYHLDYEVLTVYCAQKGPFPKYLVDSAKKFFYDKSALKEKEQQMKTDGVRKDSEEYQSNHKNMMISKGLLNGIYGMSATDPIRCEYYESDAGEWTDNKLDVVSETYIKDNLDKFYDGKNNFMQYYLGCWTTSQARNMLFEFIELIGYENFLYADTDSIFYITNDEIEKRVEDKNEEYRKDNDINGYYIDTDKKRYYFRQFDSEEEDIREFRFLHAKCYAYIEHKDGKRILRSTIAGVTDRGSLKNNYDKGLDLYYDGVRSKELRSLEELTDHKKFYKCAGTQAVYVLQKPAYINIDGHEIETAGGQVITDVESKTLKGEIAIQEDAPDWEMED